jgi:lipase
MSATLAYGQWPGSGSPVVALHGITASHLNFVGVAERLAGRAPLVAFDLRGRGDSEKSGPYGMAQHADDVAATMIGLGLERCLVVGHSMGGFVAVALAAAYPSLASRVLLIDGGLPLAVPPGVDPATLLDVVLAPQLARLRMTFESRAAYHDYWRAMSVFPPGTWSPWVERYLDYDLDPSLRSKVSEAAVRADFLDTANAGTLRSRLAEVTVPVLMLRAEEGFFPGQSPLYPDDLVAREGAAVADFTQRLVPGSTHYTIALADPHATAVADAIVAFRSFGGQDPTPR